MGVEAYVLRALHERGWDRVYEIFLRDHVVAVRIGVHDFEKAAPQRVRIEVLLFVAERAGELADEIDQVVDYEFVRESIHQVVDAGHLALQETLVGRVLTRLMDHPGVLAAVVSSSKLDVYPDCEIGCRMTRIRERS